MMKGRFTEHLRSSFVQERSMRSRSMWVGALGLALAVTVTACGGGGSKPSCEPAGGGGGRKVERARAGEVDGVVSSDGVAPKNEPIKMNADPVCVKENPTPQTQETYEVDNGKLATVFVYVKDGLGNYSFDPPTGG